MYLSQIHPLFRTSRATTGVQAAINPFVPWTAAKILNDFSANFPALLIYSTCTGPMQSLKSINQIMSLPMTDSLLCKYYLEGPKWTCQPTQPTEQQSFPYLVEHHSSLLSNCWTCQAPSRVRTLMPAFLEWDLPLWLPYSRTPISLQPLHILGSPLYLSQSENTSRTCLNEYSLWLPAQMGKLESGDLVFFTVFQTPRRMCQTFSMWVT